MRAVALGKSEKDIGVGSPWHTSFDTPCDISLRCRTVAVPPSNAADLDDFVKSIG